MNTLQKAMTGVALSLAVGSSAYAAEVAFSERSSTPYVAFEHCGDIEDSAARKACIEDAAAPTVTWPGVVELGSLASLTVCSWVALGSLRRNEQ